MIWSQLKDRPKLTGELKSVYDITAPACHQRNCAIVSLCNAGISGLELKGHLVNKVRYLKSEWVGGNILYLLTFLNPYTAGG